MRWPRAAFRFVSDKHALLIVAARQRTHFSDGLPLREAHMNSDAKIQAIRQGAAAMSELLAKGTLAEDDWERTAELLLKCRRNRAELRRTLVAEVAPYRVR